MEPHQKLLRRFAPPAEGGQAAPEHLHLFSQEAEDDIVQTDRILTLRLIEEMKTFTPRRVWEAITEEQMERDEDRAGKIRLYFHQRRTGLPF